MTKGEKREVRKGIGRISRFAMIYTIIFTATSWAVILGITVAKLAGNPNIGLEELEAVFYSKSGQYSLAALVVCAVYVLLVRRKKLFTEDLRHPEPKNLPLKVFLICFVFLYSFQALTLLGDTVTKWVAGLFGYSVSSTIESIANTPTTLWTVLYAAFFAPIMEEVVFRGVVMHRLKKYGKVFAIVTSAFMFGIFHGDLNQGLFAFGCGIMFGYVAMEYSIKWSMLLHIVNNLVIADLVGRLLQLFPTDVQDTINFILVIGIGGVIGLILLVINRKKILDYMAANRSEKGTVSACWTTPSFLLFLAMELMLMTIAFNKIG